MDKSYEIQNLDCAHCGAKIEEAIRALEGVEEAILNFPLKKLMVKGEHTEELLRQMNDTARSIEPEVVIVPLSGARTYEFSVENLDCAHCGEKIRAMIAEMNGIESAVLNFPLKKLTVVGRVDEETVTLMNELAQALEPGTVIVPVTAEKEHEHHHEEEENSKTDFILLVIGIVLFAAAVITGRFTDSKLAVLPLFIAAYLILGRDVLKATFRNIKARNFFDENTLMTVATIGAFALGEYAEAVGVMLFFKIGEMFEERAVAKSRKAITEASELRVDEADVLRDGAFVRISADDIRIDDIIRVKAGERIAADGIVETGSALIDTSAVTGEPLPVS